MIWLFVGAVIYLAGWVGTARWVAYEEIKDEGSIKDDLLVKLLATFWPFTLPVGVVLLLFESLYKAAVKDVGVSRAERKERRIKERDRVIKELEVSTEIVKPEPKRRESYVKIPRTVHPRARFYSSNDDYLTDKPEWDWGD